MRECFFFSAYFKFVTFCVQPVFVGPLVVAAPHPGYPTHPSTYLPSLPCKVSQNSNSSDFFVRHDAPWINDLFCSFLLLYLLIPLPRCSLLNMILLCYFFLLLIRPCRTSKNTFYSCLSCWHIWSLTFPLFFFAHIIFLYSVLFPPYFFFSVPNCSRSDFYPHFLQFHFLS